MAKILIIDDHDSMREGLELLLRRRGHRTLSACNGAEGLEILEGQDDVDLIVADLKMEPVDGMEVLRAVRERAPGIDVLIITAYGSVEIAVEAMKAGAVDFIEKPFRSEAFAARVESLLRARAERERLRDENIYLRGELDREYGEILGRSPAMKEIYTWIGRVAQSDSTLMIYGESGTGKELVARAIHLASPRASAPFIRVNCGALPEGILDSELFGHERGAFTGAERRRRGRFELAEGGTLFLDEIATIRPETQVRLLRVLQEREIERVGGEETIPVDVRIIAATNRSPEALKLSDDFREDLFYRLHVVPIVLPPLRERTEDIPLLAAHFIDKLKARTRSRLTGISDEAMAALEVYDWPGNVRELENVIERALVLARGAVITPADLPALSPAAARPLPTEPVEGTLQESVEAYERELLRRSLVHARGVKAEAARLLGIPPATLHYKLQKYGIDT
ncbi:MAG: sigma-54-dependent Fis family transcriptional regulator [Gemmatimonadota bacterium]|nr:MAG: sigma-54-dependent Fis family transcriptional regulator [Gemmatimonadota bacterium]